LTVTHEDLERDPQMFESISNGWPKVLSNLETLLETGRALPHSPLAAKERVKVEYVFAGGAVAYTSGRLGAQVFFKWTHLTSVQTNAVGQRGYS